MRQNCQVLTEKLLQINKKNLLAENELRKLKTFDSGYFFGKRHFEEDGPQNYLVFQPINRCFKVTAKIMFHHANLKDYLLKILHFLLHLIIVLLPH